MLQHLNLHFTIFKLFLQYLVEETTYILSLNLCTIRRLCRWKTR